MLGLFKLLFEGRNLPPEKVESYARDFLLLVISVMIEEARGRLNEDESEKLRTLVDSKEFDQAAKLIQGKYGESEWAELIDSRVSPVMDSYFEEVLRAA